jgi:hypothetical protein
VKDFKKISDLKPGKIGYTMPWAFKNGEPDHLRKLLLELGFLKPELIEDYPLTEKGGAASLRVQCTSKGSYKLKFESPEYAHPPYGEPALEAEWRSVEDSLPSYYVWTLCIDEADGHFNPYTRYVIAERLGGDVWQDVGGRKLQVTHWMHLPDPPANLRSDHD